MNKPQDPELEAKIKRLAKEQMEEDGENFLRKNESNELHNIRIILRDELSSIKWDINAIYEELEKIKELLKKLSP